MSRLILTSLLITSLVSSPARASSLEDEAQTWLQAFLKVDTVNPPGNESRAVDFYGAIFDEEGIEWHSAESAPGRGNIWARIEGGDKPALILLQHTDVVPGNPRFWSADILSGEARDGYIWGRGALDMKGIGIAHLAAFLELHRSGQQLNRDVVFLAAADEEAGGNFGVGWLIEHHPEIFAGAGLLLNEGGGGVLREGRASFGVEVTQKVPVWIRVSAVGAPGHGSMPGPSSSVTRVVKAMNLLHENPFPPRIIPAVQAMFGAMANDMPAEQSAAFRNITLSVQNPDFVRQLQDGSPQLHSLIRDTCSVTRLQGSAKINVIPAEAWAEIDCRILPDRPVKEFVVEFEEVIASADVEVEILMAFSPAISSIGTEVYSAIEDFAAEFYPDAQVMPAVLGGFTDSHFTRDIGIESYGFSPFIIDADEVRRIHGNDERISIDAFRQGIIDMIAITKLVVFDD